MKKIFPLILIIGVLLMLAGCDGEMSGMPKYIDKECYYDKGFQDYTDYCKYYYDEETVKEFATHPKFNKIQEADLENIRSYFANFEIWARQTDYYGKYDFDCLSQVKTDDYVYIFTKDGQDKFANYDVYYVDMSTNTLYFIHSNT